MTIDMDWLQKQYDRAALKAIAKHASNSVVVNPDGDDWSVGGLIRLCERLMDFRDLVLTQAQIDWHTQAVTALGRAVWREAHDVPKEADTNPVDMHALRVGRVALDRVLDGIGRSHACKFTMRHMDELHNRADAFEKAAKLLDEQRQRVAVVIGVGTEHLEEVLPVFDGVATKDIPEVGEEFFKVAQLKEPVETVTKIVEVTPVNQENKNATADGKPTELDNLIKRLKDKAEYHVVGPTRNMCLEAAAVLQAQRKKYQELEIKWADTSLLAKEFEEINTKLVAEKQRLIASNEEYCRKLTDVQDRSAETNKALTERTEERDKADQKIEELCKERAALERQVLEYSNSTDTALNERDTAREGRRATEELLAERNAVIESLTGKLESVKAERNALSTDLLYAKSQINQIQRVLN